MPLDFEHMCGGTKIINILRPGSICIYKIVILRPSYVKFKLKERLALCGYLRLNPKSGGRFGV